MNVKKVLTGAVMSVCATAGLVAATMLPAGATYLTTCAGNTVPGLDVCIRDYSPVISLFTASNVDTNAVHLGDVAGYIDVYKIPNTAEELPCVVLVVNGGETNPCATIGLIRDTNASRIELYSGPLDGATPTVGTPLATLQVCSAKLYAAFNNTPINGQQITTPCASY